MKLREAAKRARIDLVEAEIPNQDPVALTRLLRATTTDFHTIPKTHDHTALSKRLLDEGATVDIEMIHQASRSGSLDLTNLLVEAHPDSLCAFAAAGLTDEVERLLADSVTDTDEGRFPLHFCTASALGKNDLAMEKSQLEIASLLLETGPVDSPIKCCGLPDITPLLHACWTGGSLVMVRKLIDTGANPTERCLWGAVGHWQRHGDGNYHIAELLLTEGVDINHYLDGRTLLHAFAAHEDQRGVRWLLENGANVNALDDSGMTPLHAAARRNTGIRTVTALLDHGADPTIRDTNGHTPLDLARASNRSRIIDVLEAT